jgi:hypothetical protein
MGYKEVWVDDDDLNSSDYYLNQISNVTGKISGLIGSLRTDALFGKRTNDNAEEIIGYLEMISEALEEID